MSSQSFQRLSCHPPLGTLPFGGDFLAHAPLLTVHCHKTRGMRQDPTFWQIAGRKSLKQIYPVRVVRLKMASAFRNKAHHLFTAFPDR